MSIMRIVALACVVAAATWVIGWWSVPLCGAGFAVLRRGSAGVVREATFGAMLAWAGLLAYQVVHPAFGRLAASAGAAIPLPTPVLLLVAVLFAGALSGSAARLLEER
jgi:hypothetical protein